MSDIYCFICGMTSSNTILLNYDQTNIDEINNNRNKPIELKTILNLGKKLKHLNNCTILTLDNKIIHNCSNYDCYSQFKDNTNNTIYEMYEYFQNKKLDYHKKNNDSVFYEKLGVFLHTDCWKFILKTYNIELKFSDLPILEKDDRNKFKTYYHPYIPRPFYIIDYGTVQKYWSQYFNYIQLIDDKNEWMTSSLLENNKKNITRVKKIISQLKLKNDPKRKGPNISATFYDDNIIRIGNNNNFWITKNNKWNEIKKPIVSQYFEIKNSTKKLDKKIINNINNISQIGQYSKIPVFMYNFICYYSKEIKSYIYVFYLVAFEEDMPKIKIKFNLN